MQFCVQTEWHTYPNSYSEFCGILPTLTPSLWEAVNTPWLLFLLCKMGEIPVGELCRDQKNGYICSGLALTHTHCPTHAAVIGGVALLVLTRMYWVDSWLGVRRAFSQSSWPLLTYIYLPITQPTFEA